MDNYSTISKINLYVYIQGQRFEALFFAKYVHVLGFRLQCFTITHNGIGRISVIKETHEAPSVLHKTSNIYSHVYKLIVMCSLS